MTELSWIPPRYRFLRDLRRGAEGRSVVAQDSLRPGTMVVLKEVEQAHALATLDALERLTLREHPNLGLPEGIAPGAHGRAWLVTPWHSGGDLDAWIATAPQLADRLRVSVEVLRGLRVLHEAGVLHRDVKPSNVVLGADGAARLIDFGAAQAKGAQSSVAGTVSYWSPEILAGESASAASDVWACGALIAELLGWRRPQGLEPSQWLDASEPLIEWSEAHRAPVRAVLEAMLATEPTLRPPSAAQALLRLCAALPAAHRVPPESEKSAMARLQLPGTHGRPELASALQTAVDNLGEPLATGESTLRILWIEGPAGAGRTAVLQAARWNAMLRGVDAPDIQAPAANADLAAWLGLHLPIARRSDPGALAEAVLEQASRRSLWLGVDDVDRCPPALWDFLRRLARARHLRPESRLVVMLASAPPTAHNAAIADLRSELDVFCTLSQHVLEPLNVQAVQTALDTVGAGQGCPDSLAVELHRLSGGQPAELNALAACLVRLAQVPLLSGAPFPTRLPEPARRAAGQTLHAAQDTVQALPPSERDGAAILAAAACAVDEADIDAFLPTLVGVRAAAVIDAGFAQRWDGPRGPQVAPRTGALAEAARQFLESKPELAEAGAQALSGFGDRWAAAAAHLFEVANRHAETLVWAARAGAYGLAVRALDRLLETESADRLSGDCIAAGALALVRTGAPERARALALGQSEPGTQSLQDPILCVRLAELELESGRPRQALDWLQAAGLAAPDVNTTTSADPWPGALAARAHLLLGEYDDALSRAATIIRSTPTPNTPPLFHAALTAALALLYLGQTAEAIGRLEALGPLGKEPELAREQPFVFNALGLAYQKSGDVERARKAYTASQAAAEAQQNLPRLGIARMNLGTISQELGELESALWHYAQAEQVARRSGDDTALVKALLNQANLAMQAGSLSEAPQKISLGQRLAVRLGNAYLSAYLCLLEGELAVRNHTPHEANAPLQRAREGFEALGAARELAETHLLRARAAVLASHPEQLKSALGQLDSAAAKLDSPRLRLWAAAIRAQGQRYAPAPAQRAAADALAGALQNASDLRPEDRWRAHALLAWLYAALGEAALSQRHAGDAHKLVEGLASQLDETRRAQFLAQPDCRRALIDLDLARRPAGSGATNALLDRVLELNQRLAAERDPERLLETILDVAIATTSAERGFILAPASGPAEFNVQTARNYDRASLRRKEFRFSTGVARDVYATGRSLLSVDAAGDERLASLQSVHALKLRSVLAVPMRHRGAPLGVIYVDNRFQAGAFTRDHLRFLEAFADQAAVALAWTHVLAEEKRARESLQIAHTDLSTAQAEVKALNARLVEQLDAQSAELESTRHALQARQPLLTGEDRYAGIIGASEPMQRVFALIRRVKDTNVPVLVTGESGTGKELVASALHFESRRAKSRFVSINCGAMPETLLEAELFGSVRGAFTGADRDRAGLFEEANGGTLFMDELGEMSLTMQVKLLRVLELGEVRRVGASDSRRVDVRVVAATNRDLKQRVAEGHFREDLYFRLNVVEIKLPPLRDRPGDLPLLVDFLLERIAQRHNLGRKTFTHGAMRAALAHPWPGNVRELTGTLTSAVLLSDGEQITPADMGLAPQGPPLQSPTSQADYRWDGRSQMDDIESAIIADALDKLEGNKSRTAAALGLDRNTFYARLAKYGLHSKKS